MLTVARYDGKDMIQLGLVILSFSSPQHAIKCAKWFEIKREQNEKFAEKMIAINQVKPKTK